MTHPEWTVTVDIGLVYVTHTPSLDMVIVDRVTLDVVENDLNGREIPIEVQREALALTGAGK